MAKLVQYGEEEKKDSATTRVHIVRRGPKGTGHEEERRIQEDCAMRDEAGKYFVRVDVETSKASGRHIRSSTMQARLGPRHEYHVHMTSDSHDIRVTTTAVR